MRISKKFIAWAVALAMLISLVSSLEFSAFAADFEGSGTSGDPYIISDLSKLEKFRDYVNEKVDGYYYECFKLAADIDMSDKYGENKDSWTPIGSADEHESAFAGTFDGDGHTISGLYINSTDDNQGLFGYMFGATVKNLSVNGTITGGYYMGGIAGNIGGGSTIENCQNNCAVIGDGDGSGGGIVGTSDHGTIRNCFNSGAITGIEFIGGIAGFNSGGVIDNCYNVGEISGEDHVYGISHLASGSITDCYYLDGTREDPNATAKTADEFKSGEVAYLLQSGCDSPTWGQNGDFPDLIALNDDLKILRKVTFVSEHPNIGAMYVPDGEKLSVQNDYPYIKWSKTAPDSGEQAEFDLNSPITSDMTLYLIEGREFEQSSEGDIAIKAEFGFPFEQDLSSLLKLTDGSGISSDDLEFELKNGSTLPSSFTLEGGKLKSDCVADTGTYSITFNVTDKKPYSNIALTALDPNPAEFLAELTVTLNISFRGGGTKDSPYEIPSLATFEVFRDYINSGKGDGEYFELTDDIDLGGEISPWTPIGGLSNPFGGTFDGGGHTISGLNIDSDESYLGLFGNSGGTVKNLGVSGEITGGGSYVGGVAGYSSGTIENCYSICSVSGGGNVGGITGDNYYGEITNCYNAGAVSATSNVGGIAGFNRGTIEKCYSSSAVSASSPQLPTCGAIAGKSSSGEISDCYYLIGTADGGIAGSDQTGGTNALSADGLAESDLFVGWDFDGKWEINPFLKRPTLKSVPQPFNISSKAELESLASYVNSGGGSGANILLTADIDLGGSAEKPWTPIGTEAAPFSGTFDGGGHTISGLYTDQNNDYQGLFGYAAQGSVIKNFGIIHGSVSGSGSNVGSVAGYSAGEISRCYSAASSSGGGIVGSNAGDISNCYNIGAADVGGIAAANSGSISNCYNIGKSGSGISGSSSGAVSGCCYLSGSASASADGAKAVSSADLAKKETFEGWDFDTVWEIGALSRPTLISISESIFSSGSGSEKDPYIIDSASSLDVFANYVNGGNGKDEFFKLNNDIDLGGAGNNFTPIGSASAKFGGTFDGSGHKISGLNIDSSGDDQGLFGYIDSRGSVKDLSVEGSVKGKDNVGGIAGQCEGTIESCHNACGVTGTNNVGGIAGQIAASAGAGGTIKYCYNSGAVSGQDTVGGLVGNNLFMTQDSYNIGSVSGTNNVGGAVGKNNGDNSDVKHVYNIGKVSGSGSNVGGVIGSTSGIVDNNYYLDTCGAAGSGTGLSSDKFADKGSFTGFDFDTVWKIDQGTALRPILTSNPEPSLFAGGSGTSDDPYEIPDLETLETFEAYFNSNSLSQLYYELTDDIDMSKDYGDGKKSWTPIGNSGKKFNGVFLGNGYEISGLYINSNNDYQGLFGYIDSGASVKDLTIGGSVKGKNYVGGIAGQSDGSIENCHSDCAVTGTDNVGGISGSNTSKISECENSAAVSAGVGISGGITGSNTGQLDNCENSGSVSSSTDNSSDADAKSGGIAGEHLAVSGVHIQNCTNYGTVSSKYSGGIAGVSHAYLGYCENYGSIDGTYSTGGIVGKMENSGGITTEYCTNYGDVTNPNYVGGITGINDVGSHKGSQSTVGIKECSNVGTVSALRYGGGVAGQNNGVIEDSRNIGSVIGSQDGNNDLCIGGIAGDNGGVNFADTNDYDNAVIRRCYNTGDIFSNKSGASCGGISGSGTRRQIKSCYNVGSVKGGKYNGGIEGYTDYCIRAQNCYNYGTVEGESIVNVVRKRNIDDEFDSCYTLTDAAQKNTTKSNKTGYSAEEPSVNQFRSLASSLGSDYKDDAFLGRPILKDNPEDGGGTQDDPHLISSLAALETFRDYINEGNGSGEYFKLTADIDMSGKYGENKDSWTSIGWGMNANNGFSGTFDGDGHTISGLYINNSDNPGLFGTVSGTIKNLSVSGTVNGGYDTDFGGIAGYLQRGTIESCRNSCAVSGSANLGGIVSKSSGGTIKNCINDGPITGDDIGIGGIVGLFMDSTVQNCYNVGEINGYVIHDIGYGTGTTVTNCYYLNKNMSSDPNATEKTIYEFQSGEVAWLLQSGCDSPTWGQNGDFPDLIALNDDLKILRKVTFVSEHPNIGALYVPDGERLSVKDDYPYVKWSQTAPGAEQPEFDLSAPITSDLTLYLIEGREFEQSSEGDITLKAECGAPFEQDLSSLLKFEDGSEITGSDFEFELKKGSTLPSSFTFEDGKLKSDCVVSDIGKYSVTFNITDKKPYSNIALAALDPNPAEFYAELTITLDVNFSGGGTADSPYEIRDLEALEVFRSYVNAGKGSGEYFKLTADIDMSGKYGENKESWSPIGSFNKEFDGIFDGDGHTISGLYINTTDDYQGLFGAVEKDCTIKNLGVRGTVAGGFYTGGIVGYIEYGTIENCKNDCAVSGKTAVGGVAGGTCYAKVLNCFNGGAVTGSDIQIGGVVGENAYSTMQNCYNVGEVSADELVYGICDNDYGTITDCYYLEGTREDPNAKTMTADEFKSGEAAWLLQSGCDEPTWGQKIGEDNYPILTSDADKKVVKVTFSTNDNADYAASYTNAGGKVTLPDDPDIDGAEFEMWSTSSAAPFEEFTADTSVTEDTVVHSVGRELFGGESDAISLSGTYGEGITADLSQYIEYKNGASVSGGFRYTISDEGQTEAAINGSMLAIPKNTNAGSYTLKVTVEEKTPLFSLASVETFGTDPVTLTINVNIAKADPVVVVKSANALYDDDPEPDDLVTGTTSGGTLQYSLDGETYTEEIPKAHDAGEYTVWYKVVGDNNYNDAAPKSINVKIAHGFADVATKPRAVRGLVFSGEPQELITAGSGTNGEMQYSLDGENYSPEIPTGTAAGQYTVWYKVVGGFIDGKHYHDSEAASLTATIVKGDSAVESDGADVVYGDEFTLTAEVSKADAVGAALASDEDKVDFYIGETLLGSADADYGGAELKDSGTATLTVTADKKFAIGANAIRADYGGSVNLNGSKNDSITVTMTQKPIEYEVSARNKTYDGTADVEVTLTPTNNGDDDVALTAKGTAPTANAGSYETVDLTEIAISGADARYYSADSEKSGVELETFAAISKAQSSVKTPPAANDLTYTGEAQALVTAGEADGGTLVYSLEQNGEYSEKIPTGTNAGDYTVWYKVIGDSNHSDTEPQSAAASIKKAVSSGTVTANDLTYTGETQELVTAGEADGGKLVYSLEQDGDYTENIPTGTNAGDYTVWYKVIGDSNHSDSEPRSITVNIAKADPIVTVKSAKALYDDEVHELVTYEATSGVTVLFSDSENGEYSEAIPTGTAAGEYTVWYKAVGNSNYNDLPPASVKVKIAHGFADVTKAPTAVENLVYSGSPQRLVTPGEAENGEMRYSLDGENYSAAIPSAAEAGTYTVWYMAVGGVIDGKHYHDSDPLSITVNVAKADPTVTVRAAKALYDDEVHELVTYEAPSGVTVLFSDSENGEYSEAIPTGTAAGEYTVWYKAVGNNNYNDLPPASVKVKIAHGFADVTKAPTAIEDLVYNGSPQRLVTPGEAENGEMRYSLDGENYSAEIPTAAEAGTYTIWYMAVGSVIDGKHYHDSDPSSITVNIAKADPIVTVRSAKALYDDSVQELVTYEAPSGVTVLFSDSENGEYSATIPTGKAAGEYTVWYKAVGNNNYNDLPPASVKVKIAHGFAEVTKAPTAIENLVYSGSPQQLITPGEAENGEMRYSLDGENYSAEIPTATDAGEYTVWYMAVGGVIDGKQYHDSDPLSLTVTIAMQGDFDYIIKSAAINADGKLDVELEYQEEIPIAAKLIVASYDAEGALTETRAFDINGANVDLGGYEPRGDIIKIFIWSGLDDMTPLAAPYEIK